MSALYDYIIGSRLWFSGKDGSSLDPKIVQTREPNRGLRVYNFQIQNQTMSMIKSNQLVPMKSEWFGSQFFRAPLGMTETLV